MTREGTLNRIGVDLGTLDAQKLPDPKVPDCPGAMLRLTRHDFDALAGGGEYFLTKRADIPVDGYGSVRVRCDQQVAQLPKTASRTVLYYGLCHSCSGLEAQNREDLCERQRVKEGGR